MYIKQRTTKRRWPVVHGPATLSPECSGGVEWRGISTSFDHSDVSLSHVQRQNEHASFYIYTRVETIFAAATTVSVVWVMILKTRNAHARFGNHRIRDGKTTTTTVSPRRVLGNRDLGCAPPPLSCPFSLCSLFLTRCEGCGVNDIFSSAFRKSYAHAARAHTMCRSK